ncbi:MAG: ABC transporter substrate-binding protein [Desulfobacteraceae bacterium]|nr:MAG: ABC transporter substrate-binding protein [Desulfobacteraceae bacterium]
MIRERIWTFFRNCAGLFWLIYILAAAVFIAPVQGAPLLKVGVLEEPKTLNIWLASDAWSSRVLSEICQPLFIREPGTLSLVPWLAEKEAVYDPSNLSYTVYLREAKWSDGTPFTSRDVAFTGKMIKDFKIPRFLSNWNFVKEIATPDPRTVVFYLEESMATFLARTLTTPIVQEKEWSSIAAEALKTEKPLVTLLNQKVEKPVGTGPFILKEWRQGAYLFLEKNPNFFGQGRNIAGRDLGPLIGGIIFKNYGTSDAAILDLKKGSIDMFWWGLQAGYVEDLKKEKDIQIITNEKSGLYYMGFNLRKPPFNDRALRRAVANLIDKEFIIERILQGYGVKMHTLVPPANRIWCCTDVPRYCEGLSKEDRIRTAFTILKEAGYKWDEPPVDGSGKVVKGKGIRLPDGSPMPSFTILTPPADYDPQRAMVGTMAQEWLREFGMPVSAKPMAFGSLTEQVKGRRDFDAFVLGYGKLSLDPDYVRNFFVSANDKPQGWNMSGYSNPEFDRLAEQSVKEMDQEKRRKLIWQMQRMIMEDVPYIPLYNPILLEAVRTDRFAGWVSMVEGIGNTWSFCELKPR